MGVKAYILIHTRTGAENEVASKLKELEGIKEVHTLFGEYDVIAVVEVPTERDLDRVVSTIRRMEDVSRTVTLIAVNS